MGEKQSSDVLVSELPKTKEKKRITVQRVLLVTTIFANLSIITVWLKNDIKPAFNSISTKLPLEGSDELKELLFGSDCANQSICEYRETSRRHTKSSHCYCDDECPIYDDCCTDFKELNRSTLKTDIEPKYTCRRISEDCGDVQLVATCPPNWFIESIDLDSNMKEMIENRCQQIVSPDAGLEADMVADPMGLMIPVTDQLTNVTYANSYCLRCNREDQLRIARHTRAPIRRPRLVAWSPVIEYHAKDKEVEDTISSVLKSSMGYALKFSMKVNKWFLNRDIIYQTLINSLGGSADSQIESLSKWGEDMDKEIGINPAPPVPIMRSLRFCNANVIKKCHQYAKYSRETKRECETGARSLVFSKYRSDRVYYNFACAACNGLQANETRCELPKQNGAKLQKRPNEPSPEKARLVLDIYDQSDERSAVHMSQCNGWYRVYDPFYSVCRCLMCGLKKRYEDGRCVDVV